MSHNAIMAVLLGVPWLLVLGAIALDRKHLWSKAAEAVADVEPMFPMRLTPAQRQKMIIATIMLRGIGYLCVAAIAASFLYLAVGFRQ